MDIWGWIDIISLDIYVIICYCNDLDNPEQLTYNLSVLILIAGGWTFPTIQGAVVTCNSCCRDT